MYVWDDDKVYEKSSSLNDGKHANFDRTNVFSLAVSSPIFGCVSETECGESLRPGSEWEWKGENLSSCQEQCV